MDIKFKQHEHHNEDEYDVLIDGKKVGYIEEREWGEWTEDSPPLLSYAFCFVDGQSEKKLSKKLLESYSADYDDPDECKEETKKFLKQYRDYERTI